MSDNDIEILKKIWKLSNDILDLVDKLPLGFSDKKEGAILPGTRSYLYVNVYCTGNTVFWGDNHIIKYDEASAECPEWTDAVLRSLKREWGDNGMASEIAFIKSGPVLIEWLNSAIDAYKI